MRILTVGNMYPPHHLGGYELMWRSWVSRMRRTEGSVRVLTTDYLTPLPDPAIEQDPDVYRELRWYWKDHAFPRLTLLQRLRLERHNAAVLDAHLEEFRPDAVSWWAMGGMSMSLIERVRRRGLPAHGTVVDDWMLYGPDVDAWRRVLRRAGALAPLIGKATGIPSGLDLASAGQWTFVSETIRRRAAEAGWRLPRTDVAHAGIDAAMFEPAPSHRWDGRLLYLGRIDERKGVGVAVRALALLPDAFTLDIIGGGDDAYLAQLREEARTRGVEHRIRFAQVPRDQVRAAYARADATLFPVLWEEPWGLVPLESMAVGTPVIATGAGGSGEYLRHGENCLLFEPRSDSEALAAAVVRLAGDESLRDRLREAGRGTAQEFSEERFNDTIRGALERAVA